jgi:pimeloyl-ACP methyl ester carboxylesterase
MKRLTLLLLCAVSLTASAQIQNVTFVHGLTGGIDSWAAADDYLRSRYPVTTKRIAYNSDQPISAIADEKYNALLSNTVVVAHSMGGLVAREMYRDHPNGKIDAMVLVGVPHLGSHAALAVEDGTAASLLALWVNDLAAGPLALGFGTGRSETLAHNYLNYLAGNAAEYFLDQVFGADAVKDLKPGSPFLQTLNQRPETTVPPAHYALWSTEAWNMQFRLWDAKADDVEDGSVLKAASVVGGIYLYASYLSGLIAGYYYGDCYEYGDLYSCAALSYWANVSGKFMHGVHTLGYYMQYDWNQFVLGTDIDALDSDGVVLRNSQRPGWIPTSKRIKILGDINHLEQRTHQNALTALTQALTAADIDIDNAPPPPLNVSILGPSSLKSGQKGTWTAGVYGGTSPFSYRWDYQLLCGSKIAPDRQKGGGGDKPGPYEVSCDAWYSGGTSTSFSRSVNGSQFDLRLRLVVTDAGGVKKTVYKTVRIN